MIGTAIPGSWPASAAGDNATVLRYWIDPPQTFISVDPGYPNLLTLTVQIANRTTAVVPCSRIVLAIPVGTDASSLTPSTSGVSVVPLEAERWLIMALDDGSFQVRPSAPSVGLQPNEGLTLVLRGIPVNRVEGLTRLAILETTDRDRAIEFPISKLRPPTALRFYITPAILAPGDPCTLVWETTAASGCTLSAGTTPGVPESLAPNGRMRLTPERTTIYTMTAHGIGPDVSQQFTVIVGNPELLSLSVDPVIVSMGGHATLQWDTVNATGIVLQPGPADPIPGASGSYDLPPQDFSQTYQVYAVNGDNRSLPTSITVNGPVANIARFEQVPNPTSPSLSTHLVWSTTHALFCKISPDPGVLVGASGALDVTLSGDTPYLLTATGQNGPTRRTTVLRRPGVYQSPASIPESLFGRYGSPPVAIATPTGLVVISGDKAGCNTFSSRDLTAWSGSPTGSASIMRPFAGGVWYKNRLWRVGGNGGEKEVCSSTDGVNWDLATQNAIWEGRQARGCVVVFKETMWLIGGFVYSWGPTVFNDAWHSTDGVTWIPAASPGGGGTPVVHNGCLWYVSTNGDDGYSLFQSADGNTWTRVTSPLPYELTREPRVSSAIHSVGGFLYVIGGVKPPYQPGDEPRPGFRDIWRMDAGGNWTQCAALVPTTVSQPWAASAVFDGRIVMFTDAPQGNVWYYVPE